MIEELLKSEGECKYCKEILPQNKLTAHFSKHLKEIEKANKTEIESAHLIVSAGPFFLHLLISADAELGELDQFFRQIWLECCGHLSSFSYESWGDEMEMDTEIIEAFGSKKILNYCYDFGTSTELTISLKNIYNIDTNEVLLLSRNEPLKILCNTCNKNIATSICSVHIYDDCGYLCKECEKIHKKECEDFADYAKMKVVNSPRAGDCAYEGGFIDKKRDGIYKL